MVVLKVLESLPVKDQRSLLIVIQKQQTHKSNQDSFRKPVGHLAFLKDDVRMRTDSLHIMILLEQ